MTKISLKVGESYRHVNHIYGVTKMVAASFEVFDSNGEIEFPDKEVVFFGDDGPDDIIDVAKFILEIDNEVVPIRISTIVFPYTGDKQKTQ